MNRCDEVLELFSLQLDDELDDVGRTRMSRHLLSCADCARLLEEMRAVDLLFRQAPMKYAPSGFAGRAVQAAWDADFQQNLLVGFLMLVVGTILIGGIFVLGRIELLWWAIATLLAPGALSNAPLWVGQAVQAVTIGADVGLSALRILPELLAGPFLVPVLASLLSTVALVIILRRAGKDTMTTI